MAASVRIGILRLMGAFVLACLGLAPTRATETVLHSFDRNYSSGRNPVGQLAPSGNTFYGVSQTGIGGSGNIFTMSTTGLVKVIHEFAGGATDGDTPNSGLIAQGGNFYGTTIYGGANRSGVVYEVTPTGTVTILYSFAGYNSATPANSDGAYPYAGLLLASDGAFYGVTYNGGNQNQGTVFTIKPDGTGYQILHNFNRTVDTAYDPLTGLAESAAGVLYGVSYGASGFTGGIFKLNKDGSGFAFVHGFTSSDPTGYNPSSDLVKATDGNFYGYCSSGGANNFGTVFKITPGSTDTVTPLWAFDGYTGAYPYWVNGSENPQNRLLIGADKNLYGVTRQGGAYGYGAAFKLTLAGACTRLTSFNINDTNSTANPLAQLGSNFYATSYNGGATAVTNSPAGRGAAVSISSTGVLKVIQSFGVQDGYNCYSNLVQVGAGAAAAFYGVTTSGGEFGDGVVFKINSAGAFTVVHHFNNYLNEGYSAVGGLVLGRDNFLYGTTTSGGQYGYGTIFKVSTAGVLTVIHNFQGFEAYDPIGTLVQGVGKDTNLYGTCNAGGPDNGLGSVFSVSTTGKSFMVLRYFSGPDGASPYGQLLPDGQGNLYGTTDQGGANNLGTIFKVSTNGATFTRLFDFFYDNVNNVYPAGYGPAYSSSMVLNGGFLYGVAERGGAHNDGVIFKCNAATGATISFHDFDNSIGEGAIPVGGLFYSSSTGFFYGVTQNGGASGDGVIYKVNVTTGALTVLHSFTGTNAANPPASDGELPYSGVFLGSDGFLYGTTYDGGSTDYGIVFQETP